MSNDKPDFKKVNIADESFAEDDAPVFPSDLPEPPVKKDEVLHPHKKEAPEVVKEGSVLNGPNEHEGNPENPNDLKRLIKAKEAKEAVTETRNCEECQGDGKWDGVICKVCHGSGKIFKDGTVVLVADTNQALVAHKGELKV